MATTARPISTISYNTEDFLKATLNRFLKARKISDYRYIKHIGEDGDKDHIHLWVQPATNRFDDIAFREEFTEADLTHNKPLMCMPFRPSNVADWLLYVVHDDVYLRNHNSQTEDGKIEYPVTDIVTPFEEQLYRDYKTAIAKNRYTKEQQAFQYFATGAKISDVSLQYGFNTGINLVRVMQYGNLRADQCGVISASENRIPQENETAYEQLDRGLQDIENSLSNKIISGVLTNTKNDN